MPLLRARISIANRAFQRIGTFALDLKFEIILDLQICI
jgi:hypothetical protein